MMKYLIVACMVFERELKKILGNGHGHEIIMLEFGYHKMPAVLQKRLQEIIDNAKGVDAILLLYGLCGGISRLISREIPVVMPKAHDCFDILLGRDKRFALFTEEPGTYFLSEGWVRNDGTPSDKVKAIKNRVRKDDYKIIDDMYAGYKRLLFVRTGAETEESITRSRLASLEMRWYFEETKGDLLKVRKIFSGQWDDDFIVLNDVSGYHSRDFLASQLLCEPHRLRDQHKKELPFLKRRD